MIHSVKTRIALFALISATVFSCKALDVKGLKIGSVVNQSILQSIFGYADCEDKASLHDAMPIFCNVPISYLGIKTSAVIHIDKKSSRAIFMSVKLSEDKLAQIEQLFSKKYGLPNLRRGTSRPLELVDPKTKATKKVDFVEPCTTWNHVDDSTISVCEARPAPGYDIPRVQYSYVGKTSLDPTDI